MKKIIAMILALVLCFGLVACGGTASKDDPTVKSEGVMTYAEYDAAELNSTVVIETYVQGKQSWWDNQASLYTQDADGAYFIYNAACSEEDYAKLVPGQKIKVTGVKSEWSGEVEIMDGTIEILEGNYLAAVTDVTAQLGTDELAASQNQYVAFKGLTVAASTDADGNEVAFLYNWDGSGQAGTDSDLYFNVTDAAGNTYTFVVEYYTCDAEGAYGADTAVYEAVTGLQVGDVIDLEGFLYWYNGAQPHITAVSAAA
ncbi:MAG: hypothetical protein J6J04_05080 [Oscillospiraceae bacterium]|nr:hypothetical protein [Oscillospiraceae bacterium]